MSALLNAAEAIKREARRAQELIAAAEHLERIGSLEQAEQQATRAHKEAVERLAEARAALESVNHEIAEANERAAMIIANANAEATELVRGAKAEADEIIGKASADTGRAIVDAARDADRIASGAKAEAAAAAASRDKAREELSAVQKQIAQATADLETLRGKIAAAKQQARALIEG